MNKYSRLEKFRLDTYEMLVKNQDATLSTRSYPIIVTFPSFTPYK